MRPLLLTTEHPRSERFNLALQHLFDAARARDGAASARRYRARFPAPRRDVSRNGYRFAKSDGEQPLGHCRKSLRHRHFLNSESGVTARRFRFSSSRCLNCHSNFTDQYALNNEPANGRGEGDKRIRTGAALDEKKE